MATKQTAAPRQRRSGAPEGLPAWEKPALPRPVAVGTPRSFNFFAMPYRDVMPVARIAVMMGARSTALASAVVVQVRVRVIAQDFVSSGAPVVIELDDTIERRWGGFRHESSPHRNPRNASNLSRFLDYMLIRCRL